MNKYFILAAAFAVSMLGSVHAQTVAQNWTKSDCDGNSHTLFTELDSGCIVIMDFAMTHCIPCKIATIALTQLDSKYSASHPEKLRHYAMGYINSYTCDDMAQWKLDGNFTIPTMIKCAADVQNYGGMGMPTIVIVGGKDHKILYKRQGFVSKDTIAMIAAIV